MPPEPPFINQSSNDSAPERMLLRCEFASVRIEIDDSANGPRLAVTDLRSGRTSYFDPLELEALVWVSHDELTDFMNPERRWADEPH
jgi:hypothetical protein